MRAEKVIHSLLVNASAVAALVVDRVAPPPLPQGSVLPAIAVEHISSNELTTIDANAPFGLVQSRIQVTAIAATYVQQKSLIEEIRKACNYQRGLIAGVRVVSVLRAGVGPDDRDDDKQQFFQSIDFLVTFQEP